MGMVIEKTERVSTEVRRESIAVTVSGATVDQSDGYARMEIDLGDVLDVIGGLADALASHPDEYGKGRG